MAEATRLTCSIGLAPNKLMAKIASDFDKPDGLFVLTEEKWLEAVGEKPASLLPGVGPKTFQRLEGIGITTVAELAGADVELLERTFGPNHGQGLIDRGNGIGSSKLTTERRRKSESRETTFSADVDDAEKLRETLERLARSVCGSLEKHGSAGRTVTMKIRLRPFRTFTRSRTLPEATRDPEAVVATARELLENFERDAPVRLIGVGLAGLESDAEDDDADGDGGPENGPAAPDESMTLDV